MQKRLRAMTYAEALEAKKLAEDKDEQIVEEPKAPEIDLSVSTLNSVEILSLPSGGGAYSKNAELYFTPLSFGEMKFLSGSTLNDVETINFFKKKMQANFPIDDLTYYDFYYVTVLIKMATFGEVKYNMSFECNKCGFFNKSPFSTEDLAFEEIRVPLPVKVDLREKFTTKGGEVLDSVSFLPMNIGNFLKMVENNEVGDDDVYMSLCIVEGSDEDKLKLIKEYLNGPDTQILESIDVYMFHGVQNLPLTCSRRSKPDNMSEKEFKIALDNREDVGEVCGHVHDVPFQHISEYTSSTDEFKQSFGERVHFGV